MAGLDDKLKKYGIPGAGVETAFKKFQNSDLVAGVYTFNHKLETQYPNVIVYDDVDEQIQPDDVTAVDENRLAIDLTSFGVLTGWYKVRAVGG